MQLTTAKISILSALDSCLDNRNINLKMRADLLLPPCFFFLSGFDWSLHFKWEQIPIEQKMARSDPTQAIRYVYNDI